MCLISLTTQKRDSAKLSMLMPVKSPIMPPETKFIELTQHYLCTIIIALMLISPRFATWLENDNLADLVILFANWVCTETLTLDIP